MKHEADDSSSRPRIKVVVDWLKGIKMDIPYSRWVMFSIGFYVICAAIAKIAPVISLFWAAM